VRGEWGAQPCSAGWGQLCWWRLTAVLEHRLGAPALCTSGVWLAGSHSSLLPLLCVRPAAHEDGSVPQSPKTILMAEFN